MNNIQFYSAMGIHRARMFVRTEISGKMVISPDFLCFAHTA